ncbi:hypothetical protein [Roseococcus sp.]|uniref:hypothetical protein n=1 Tax=Roseococcus sp. TaxID=2109646 RepID=UPI003BA89210
MIGAEILRRGILTLRLWAHPGARISAPMPARVFPAPAAPPAEDDLGELRYLICSRGVQPVRLGQGARERYGFRELRAFNIGDDGAPVLTPRWRREERLFPTIDAARVAYARTYERTCTHFRGVTRRAVQSSLLDLAPGSGPARRPLPSGRELTSAASLGVITALSLIEWILP